MRPCLFRFLAIMRTFSMMQEDMSPYMADLLTQLIAKLAAVSKVFSICKIIFGSYIFN